MDQTSRHSDSEESYYYYLFSHPSAEHFVRQTKQIKDSIDFLLKNVIYILCIIWICIKTLIFLLLLFFKTIKKLLSFVKSHSHLSSGNLEPGLFLTPCVLGYDEISFVNQAVMD